MRIKSVSILAIFLALMITVPALTSCEAVASYLIYQWIDDEFNNGGDDDDSEDPTINNISIDREIIYVDESVILEVDADDNQDSSGELEYFWVASAGTLINPTSSITVWLTPSTEGNVTISIIVRDTDGNEDSATVEVSVLAGGGS